MDGGSGDLCVGVCCAEVEDVEHVLLGCGAYA